MISKKLLFSFILSILMVQAVDASSSRQPRRREQAKSRRELDFLFNDELINYLTPTANPLFLMIRLNDIDGFRRIENNAGRIMQDYINEQHTSFGGNTALHVIINALNTNSFPPNSSAADFSNMALVLLRAGARVDIPNDNGDTAQDLDTNGLLPMIIDQINVEEQDRLMGA